MDGAGNNPHLLATAKKTFVPLPRKTNAYSTYSIRIPGGSSIQPGTNNSYLLFPEMGTYQRKLYIL
jgi:hypothetical protein